MKKNNFSGLGVTLIVSSCVSQKKFTLKLERKTRNSGFYCNSATVKLNSCLEEKASASLV